MDQEQPRAKGGRPPFEPTDQQREMVKELASLGTRQPDICRFIKDGKGRPISDATLRKYFSEELAMGVAEANARVASTLFKMAVSGAQPAATFFWLKSRAGWRETPQQLAFTDPDGNPVQPPSLGDFYRTVQMVKANERAGDGEADGGGAAGAAGQEG